MQYNLKLISETLGACLEGDAEKIINGVNALDNAGLDDISFAESDAYLSQVVDGHAGALIVPENFPQLSDVNLLRVANPRLAFVRVVEMFVEPALVEGVHPDASVHEDACIGAGITIDACAVISAGARIGDDCTIQGGAYIGKNVVLGKGCKVGPNVSLMHDVVLGDRVTVHAGSAIGGDGFGYVWMKNHHHKIPQVGTVVIEDDVEIGCNTCIDRAALGETRVGRGTKIDNLVHIAHNCEIGEDVIITGQVGLSGSVTIGNRVMFGGQSGVADHLSVGEGAMVAAASAVISDVPAGDRFWGFPAKLMSKAKREIVSLSRLPELLKRFRQQEVLLEQLHEKVGRLEGECVKKSD